MNWRGGVQKLFKEQTGNIWIQLARYSLSGLSSTVVDFTVLTVLTELFGEHLLLLWTAIAFIAGVVVTYLLSTHWVFDTRRVSNRGLELLIFIGIAIVGLALTELLMWFFAHRLDIHYLLSKVIASMMVFAWNFGAKKFFLFRK